MKRLLKKANIEDALRTYSTVINNLMSNDSNGSWDEIYDEMLYEYDDKQVALTESIAEVKDTLERIISEELNPQVDVEEYNFYNSQLELINTIVL